MWPKEGTHSLTKPNMPADGPMEPTADHGTEKETLFCAYAHPRSARSLTPMPRKHRSHRTRRRSGDARTPTGRRSRSARVPLKRRTGAARAPLACSGTDVRAPLGRHISKQDRNDNGGKQACTKAQQKRQVAMAGKHNRIAKRQWSARRLDDRPARRRRKRSTEPMHQAAWAERQANRPLERLASLRTNPPTARGHTLCSPTCIQHPHWAARLGRTSISSVATRDADCRNTPAHTRRPILARIPRRAGAFCTPRRYGAHPRDPKAPRRLGMSDLRAQERDAGGGH